MGKLATFVVCGGKHSHFTGSASNPRNTFRQKCSGHVRASKPRGDNPGFKSMESLGINEWRRRRRLETVFCLTTVFWDGFCCAVLSLLSWVVSARLIQRKMHVCQSRWNVCEVST